MSTGMLARITLGEDEVRQALERPLTRIVAALKDLLEQTLRSSHPTSRIAASRSSEEGRSSPASAI